MIDRLNQIHGLQKKRENIHKVLEIISLENDFKKDQL